jgi:phosphoglycerol transferase
MEEIEIIILKYLFHIYLVYTTVKVLSNMTQPLPESHKNGILQTSMTVLFFASIFLFLLSTYTLSRSQMPFYWVVGYIFFAILFFAISIFFALSHQFTGKGITDAVWYHIESGPAGAAMGTFTTEYSIIGFFFIVFLLLLYRSTISSNLPHTQKKFVPYTILLVTIAFTLHPSTHSIYTYAIDRYAAVSPHSIIHTAQASDTTSDFYTYYHEATLTKTRQPKNLVLLYVEGLEDTFSNETYFQDVTPKLNALRQQADVFTNIRQIEGSSFTIAGMVASQCGIPLVSAGHGNGLSGMDTFLPGARCLGDILQETGYTLTYMGGADLTFAGKGLFYSTHGYDVVEGKHELLTTLRDPSYINGWGVYDDTLLEKVYERFEILSRETAPFVLTAITLDTHPPSGFPSASCKDIIYDSDETALLSTIRCSDTLVYDLIKRIAASPHAEYTVVAIVSDHYIMKQFPRIPDEARKNRFMIFDFSTTTQGNSYDTPGSQLDIATTLLPYIGYSGVIGLGRDLRTTTTTETTGQRLFDAARNWKSELLSFWQYPTIEHGLGIDPSEQRISLGSRTFQFPVLVGFADDLSTGIAFRFNMEEHTLVTKSRALRPRQGFVLIESCTVISSFYTERGMSLPYEVPTSAQYCIVYGNNKYQFIRAMDDTTPMLFTRSELQSFIHYTVSNE